MIAPNTDLILLKCPLELDLQNQLTFSSKTAQYNYFNGLPKLVEDNFTYQRKDGKIRFPAVMDDIIEYNYCMYRNSSYSNKWFYAFITNIEYLNDNTSLISIVTDVWQTWQFDLTWKQSFVAREHTNNDAVGANILDEGLQCGEYVINSESDAVYASNVADCYIAVQCSDIPKDISSRIGAGEEPVSGPIGGVPQGCYIFLIEANNKNNIANFVHAFDLYGQGDAITAMYMMPKSFAPNAPGFSVFGNDPSGTPWSFDYWVMPTSSGVTTLWNSYFQRNNTINGYTPKNNKLFCYPYNYMLMTNNNGDDAVFHWEDFSSSQAQFRIIGIPTQGCLIKILPRNYKGQSSTQRGYIYSLNAQTLPLVSWNSDYYLNWQAQNGIKSGYNAEANYITDFGKAGEAVASGQDQVTTGNILEGAARTLSWVGHTVGSLMTEVSGGYTASITPDQTKGQTNGDMNFSYGRMCFTEYDMSIKAEVARSIDNYFSMFGYRTDKMKVPNITGRANWNYVKTMGCNVIGTLPQLDLQAIKKMFDDGVTLWHNPATFQDYSQNNNIV